MEKGEIHWSKIRRELKSFVYRSVKNNAIADDLVQDVFVKIHVKQEQLKDTAKITSWIYQITRNTIADHFRTKSRTMQLHDLDWESDDRQLNDCVALCLGELMVTLPQKYREALELTEIENLSQTDFAKRINISYSGAKSRVQRARQLLRQKMDQHYLIETDSYGNVMICESRVPCNCSAADAVTCQSN